MSEEERAPLAPVSINRSSNAAAGGPGSLQKPSFRLSTPRGTPSRFYSEALHGGAACDQQSAASAAVESPVASTGGDGNEAKQQQHGQQHQQATQVFDNLCGIVESPTLQVYQNNTFGSPAGPFGQQHNPVPYGFDSGSSPSLDAAFAGLQMGTPVGRGQRRAAGGEFDELMGDLDFLESPGFQRFMEQMGSSPSPASRQPSQASSPAPAPTQPQQAQQQQDKPSPGHSQAADAAAAALHTPGSGSGVGAALLQTPSFDAAFRRGGGPSGGLGDDYYDLDEFDNGRTPDSFRDLTPGLILSKTLSQLGVEEQAWLDTQSPLRLHCASTQKAPAPAARGTPRQQENSGQQQQGNSMPAELQTPAVAGRAGSQASHGAGELEGVAEGEGVAATPAPRAAEFGFARQAAPEATPMMMTTRGAAPATQPPAATPGLFPSACQGLLQQQHAVATATPVFIPRVAVAIPTVAATPNLFRGLAAATGPEAATPALFGRQASAKGGGSSAPGQDEQRPALQREGAAAPAQEGSRVSSPAAAAAADGSLQQQPAVLFASPEVAEEGSRLSSPATAAAADGSPQQQQQPAMLFAFPPAAEEGSCVSSPTTAVAAGDSSLQQQQQPALLFASDSSRQQQQPAVLFASPVTSKDDTAHSVPCQPGTAAAAKPPVRAAGSGSPALLAGSSGGGPSPVAATPAPGADRPAGGNSAFLMVLEHLRRANYWSPQVGQQQPPGGPGCGGGNASSPSGASAAASPAAVPAGIAGGGASPGGSSVAASPAGIEGGAGGGSPATPKACDDMLAALEAAAAANESGTPHGSGNDMACGSLEQWLSKVGLQQVDSHTKGQLEQVWRAAGEVGQLRSMMAALKDSELELAATEAMDLEQHLTTMIQQNEDLEQENWRLRAQLQEVCKASKDVGVEAEPSDPMATPSPMRVADVASGPPPRTVSIRSGHVREIIRTFQRIMEVNRGGRTPRKLRVPPPAVAAAGVVNYIHKPHSSSSSPSAGSRSPLARLVGRRTPRAKTASRLGRGASAMPLGLGSPSSEDNATAGQAPKLEAAAAAAEAVAAAQAEGDALLAVAAPASGPRERGDGKQKVRVAHAQGGVGSVAEEAQQQPGVGGKENESGTAEAQQPGVGDRENEWGMAEASPVAPARQTRAYYSSDDDSPATTPLMKGRAKPTAAARMRSMAVSALSPLTSLKLRGSGSTKGPVPADAETPPPPPRRRGRQHGSEEEEKEFLRRAAALNIPVSPYYTRK